jgi:acetoin utilization deacetylase AcuC-like enzyme
MLDLPVIWSDRCLLHDPGAEIWLGVETAADEVPERATVLRDALVSAGTRFVEAKGHDDEHLLAVHDEGLVAFLRTACERWEDAGYAADPGQERVVPYIFPHPAFVDHVRPAVPVALSARTGYYAFDTMTPVVRGTWVAARAAIDAALTAADLVLDGAPSTYACVRPPGHHATAASYGGSCYLNTAAVTAQYLRAQGAQRVAIVDVDAHHGNGAQSIFWERGDVFTGSVHVDPAEGWFPHFLGFADERGTSAGTGSNLNLTLAPGAGDSEWVAAVETLAAAVDSDALVIALGVDAAEGDPNSPLTVTAEGFRSSGRILGGLGRPAVVVQEGGYVLSTLGDLVVAFLEGLADGR